MNDTVQKIALAGLFHDIGKFAQGSLPVTQTYLDNNAGLYQPFKNYHHTHIHAVYTAAFIEEMADRLPTKLNHGPWGEGDSFINLAAGHHNPETPMQCIVTMADWISSGLDRDTFGQGKKIAYQDVKKTRLLPVLESLGPGRCLKFDSADQFQYAYPLEPLTAESIFPLSRQKKDRKEAEVEYQGLFNRFCDDLKSLFHRKSNVDLWVQHFDSLLMTYTTTIPAARVGDVVHDVSLYDHCRTTAALAAALYRYHSGSGTLEESAVRDGSPEKFLLVGGDFYGIQEFIFSRHGESGKFRSKLLRGRSFAVSLFTELAVRFICERLNLTPLSVLLNAAGKFHLLAPNLPETKETLAECETTINDWLFEHTYGESSIGIIDTAASPDEFHSGGFRKLWDRHLQNLEIRKCNKIDLDRNGGAVEGFLGSFDNDLRPNQLCPLCAKRPSIRETRNDPVFRSDDTVSCALCRDHVYLGTNLVKNHMVAICTDDADLKEDERLLAPIFGSYQVSFTKSPSDDLAESGRLLGLWQTGIEPDGSLVCRATVKLINGHVPCCREEDNQDDQIKSGGGVKTFSHIAVKARHMDKDGKCRGVEALGVLKADVDNLGMLFGCGLSDNRFTVSRLATVSRQLNNFFACYLPYLLTDSDVFYDIYTVFAGGDDLFLIGPWNRMADLARIIQERFEQFVCHNPVITISAGISIHKPNTPVDVMAEFSEEALDEAKRSGRNRVTMFGHSVCWEKFDELLKRRLEMESWLRKEYIGDAMFYRLTQLVEMAEQEKRISGARKITLKEMSCVKWPALLQYGLVRNINKRIESRNKALEEMICIADWLREDRGALRIPLWHVLYEKRV